jgi:hypothetical protein
MELNETWFKVGLLPTNLKLELGSVIHLKEMKSAIVYELTVVSSKRKDNQDGTYDEIFSLKHEPAGIFIPEAPTQLSEQDAFGFIPRPEGD